MYLADLIEQYRLHHQKHPEYGQGGRGEVNYVRDLASRFACKTIIDFGCGKGLMVELMKDLGVVGYDPAVPKFETRPVGTFDMLYSIDVLEHFPEELTDQILDQMLCYSPKVIYLLISTRPSGWKLPNNLPMHMTVKDGEWWKSKILGYFVDYRLRKFGYNEKDGYASITLLHKKECGTEIYSNNLDYGQNILIKKYCGWPLKPIPMAIPPSYDFENIPKSYILSPFKHKWVYSDRDYYQMVYLQPETKLYKMGHPFVYTSPVDCERQGTLVMPRAMRFEDMLEYYKLLSVLPDRFHPVTVCIKYEDPTEEHLFFCQKFNFETTTMRTIVADEFFQNQRNVLSKYAYVTTHYTGTPMWLAIHSGCRFFYFGKPGIYRDRMFKTTTLESSAFSLESADHWLEEKKELCNFHIGSNYRRSADEMRSIFDIAAKDDFYIEQMRLIEETT